MLERLFLKNQGNPPYWIATLKGSSSTISDNGAGIILDTLGNIYISGTSTNGGNSDFQIVKYDSSASVQWQRRLYSAAIDTASSIGIDTASNIIIAGYYTPSTTDDALLAKYNSSGTLQWQRSLSTTTNPERWYSVCTDSSDNIYVCGESKSTYQSIQLAKYNSSGTLQWQRRLGGTSSYEAANSITIDSSGYLYVCGFSSTTTNLYSLQLAKYDSSGVIQWQRKLGTSSASDYQGIAIDLSGNIYSCGYYNNGSNYDIHLVKYNNTGTLQWQNRLYSASGSDLGQSVCIGPNSDIYIAAQTTGSGAGSADWVIAKYDLSGNLIWQRTLGSSFSDTVNSIVVDSNDDLYICGSTSTNGGDILIAKLPGDGSLTGTYSLGGVNYTYAVSNLTAASTSLTSSTTTLTDTSTTLTAATPTLTSATSTLTSTVKIL